MTVVDVVLLARDARPLAAEVLRGLDGQRGVRLSIHRVIGKPQAGDRNRWETIARARNTAARQGASPWLMFLDDDVELAPDCIARLQHALAHRPEHAAFAADYLGECKSVRSMRQEHVAMGATLFRRSALQRIRFRSEANKCECLCCCEDLRRMGARIEYMRGSLARHLKRGPICNHGSPAERNPALIPQTVAQPTVDFAGARVLAAFDRRDVRRFQDVFYRSLRNSGNAQEVIAVGYGLYPSEQRLLASLKNLHLIQRPVNGQMVPIRRLSDFGEIAVALPPGTPLAYWDASDVVFQSKLDGLWRLTQQYPDRILAVREPRGYPYNQATKAWSLSIRDKAMRQKAFDLFSTRPFLNSGFAGGTAQAMAKYFREAARLRHSPALEGTSDWGDQSALNLYCHSDPGRWQEIDEGWNYCVHDRMSDEVHVTTSGLITSSRGAKIRVAHGNARSLKKLALVQ